MDIPAPSHDTPRLAYSALELRATLTAVGMLLALAAAAWWTTLGNARDMSTMVQGVAHVGAATPFDMTAFIFMGMWATMMVAMMFPTIAPIVLLHRMVMRRRGAGPAPTVAFVAGYILIWVAAGVVPLLVLTAFRQISHETAWVGRIGGVVLIIAGAYQFTRWKDTCLKACRSPLTFLLTHDFGKGLTGALRTGSSHGLYCLGCCWALMSVLFVIGLMNLTWMAIIAVVFLAEKNWRHGRALTRIVGTAVVLFGIAFLVDPTLLGAVSPMTSTRAPLMMQGG